jgi:hypothetical protein
MAAYVQFYLNRGMANGIQIVPAANIDRMEIPASTWAAKEGMRSGYGLSNYWSLHEGFVYHGHNGGVNGGLTEMAYLPECGVGYFYSINSGNGDAFARIGKAIRAYVTSRLQKPPVPPAAPLPPGTGDYAGWYQPDSPRMELTHFIERLAGLSTVRFKDGKLLITSLGGWNETFIPVAGVQFRYVPKKDPAEPVATLELLAPNGEGRFIEAGMMTTMKRVPAWLAILEIVLTAFVLLSLVSIVIYAPFWVLGGLSKKRRRPAERGMRFWPLVAVLSLVGIVVVIILSGADAISRLGNLTAWSAALFLFTLAFAIATVASAIAWLRAPVEGVRRSVRTYSLLVVSALLIATVYLAYWGFIGLRTWA